MNAISIPWPRFGRSRLASAQARSWAFLLAVVVAETLVAWVNPMVGLSLHAILVLGWIPLIFMEPNKREQDLMLGLILAPLIRLVSLALPLHLLFPLASLVLTAIPLYVAAWKVSRAVGLPAKRLGLTGSNQPGQYFIGAGGIAIGVILFQVLGSPPLATALSKADPVAAALVLVLFAGFLDEFVFRGLLQSLAYRTLGRAGPLYIAFLYAAMHIGHRSAAYVLAALLLGLVFGAIAHRSRSIVGVGLAHGLANIVVYLAMPVMAAGAPASATALFTSDMVLPALAGAGIIGIALFLAGRLASLEAEAARESRL